jgi:hypothetical protein
MSGGRMMAGGGTARLLLLVILLEFAAIFVPKPVEAREVPAALPVVRTSATEMKACVHGMLTGDEPWPGWLDHCIDDVLKFRQYCEQKMGGFVAQDLNGRVVCDKYYVDATIWEEAETLAEVIAKGVVTGVTVAAPYVMTAVHVVACVEGSIVSCALAADNILDMAGADVPYGEALGLAVTASECYDGNAIACLHLADAAGADSLPLVGAAYEKGKDALKTSVVVVGCIENQTAFQCASALGMVADQAGVKLPVEWAQEFMATLEQCSNGSTLACIYAAKELGLPEDNIVAKALSTWQQAAKQNKSVQDCLGQGNLDACVQAASSLGGSYQPYFPQDYIDQLDDLKLCANGDAKACERAAKALGLPGDKAVEAAKKKSDESMIAVASVDVSDEGSQKQTKQAQQTKVATNTNTAHVSGPVIQTQGNDNEDDEDAPPPQRVTQETTTAPVTSKPQLQTAGSNPSSQLTAINPYAGYKEQASYGGDCNKQPAGTLCLNFPDAYIWLVTDTIQKWEDRGTVDGKRVRVVIGAKAEYHHIMNTKYVREVKR